MSEVKETLQLLKAVNEIALFFVKRLKDGAGADDAMAFYELVSKDEEFKKILFEAYDKAGDAPAELKSIDAQGVINLVLEQLNYIPKIINAVKEPHD